MKNLVLSFIAGIFFCLLMGAGAMQTMTVSQPAQPKAVLTKSFRTMFGLEGDIKEFIDAKVKEGYIVKSVAMMDDDSWSKGIVVMEKY